QRWCSEDFMSITPQLLMWDLSAGPEAQPPWDLKFWVTDGIVRSFWNESCRKEGGGKFSDTKFIATVHPVRGYPNTRDPQDDDTIISWSADASWIQISDAGPRDALITID